MNALLNIQDTLAAVTTFSANQRPLTLTIPTTISSLYSSILAALIMKVAETLNPLSTTIITNKTIKLFSSMASKPIDIRWIRIGS